MTPDSTAPEQQPRAAPPRGREAAIRQHAQLLWLLVRKELKVRYKSSFLGYVWALANPLAFALVYWLAFKFIMRMDMDNYSLFLITGIFPWVWLSSAVVTGTRCFVVNTSLIKKINLPRAILPLSNVVQELAHFVFALPVIVLFLVAAGGYAFSPAWLWQIPVLLALQLAFIYPLALSLALVNVYVHDIEHLAGIGFTLMFFATPMVYPVTMVPEAYRRYFELNPFHALMQSWRSVFLQGTFDPLHAGYAAAFAALMAVVAWWLYRKLSPGIAELV